MSEFDRNTSEKTKTVREGTWDYTSQRYINLVFRTTIIIPYKKYSQNFFKVS